MYSGAVRRVRYDTLKSIDCLQCIYFFIIILKYSVAGSGQLTSGFFAHFYGNQEKIVVNW